MTLYYKFLKYRKHFTIVYTIKKIMSNLDEYMNPLQVRLVPELKLHKSAILLCFIFPVHTVEVTGCKSKRLSKCVISQCHRHLWEVLPCKQAVGQLL